jgi:hypothetical protein
VSAGYWLIALGATVVLWGSGFFVGWQLNTYLRERADDRAAEEEWSDDGGAW